MGTHRPPYCRQHANNIRWQAPHRPHTHNSATLKVHVQFPFRFGCNPLTLSSFRNPEIHNLHPEGICFWQTELKRWQCHHARFQDPREGASRCLRTVAHCWTLHFHFVCLHTPRKSSSSLSALWFRSSEGPALQMSAAGTAYKQTPSREVCESERAQPFSFFQIVQEGFRFVFTWIAFHYLLFENRRASTYNLAVILWY
jgi:hypothetical protein